MELFKKIIDILAYLSLPLMAMEIYFSLNKLWRRKHEKMVADSISLSAKFISLGPIIVFTTYYIIGKQWPALIGNIMLIFFILMQVLIGSGLWTKGMKNRNLIDLIKDSIRSESEEISNLAQTIMGHSHVDKVIDILGQIASLDDIDKREKGFIEAFANMWNLKINWEKYQNKNGEKPDFYKIHRSVQEYLSTSPPDQQATQLLEIVTMLIEVDNKVSPNEQLILDELTGLINNYVADDRKGQAMQVAVVPQNTEQERSIQDLLPELKKQYIAGGYAYVAGPFFSAAYAEIICEKYRNFSFFSVTIVPLQEKKEDKK